jgi:hypothetical protein
MLAPDHPDAATLGWCALGAMVTDPWPLTHPNTWDGSQLRSILYLRGAGLAADNRHDRNGLSHSTPPGILGSLRSRLGGRWDVSRGWKVGFIGLAIANLLTIVLPLLMLISLIRAADRGESGTEYGALVIAPVLMVGFFVAITNIALIGYYLWKRHPSTTAHILGVPVIVLSVVLVVGAGYSVADNARDARERAAKLDERNSRPQPTAVYSDITVGKAEELLLACDLRGFYFTRQTRPALGNGGELSSTGVVLTTIDDDPHRISIADRWIDRLVPVARQAQDVCGRGRPQFWHHGSYE